MTIMVSTRLPVQRAVAQVTVVTVTVTPAGEIIIYLFIYLFNYLENEGDCTDEGKGRGGAHRVHSSPSYATLRAALGIETDPW